MQADDAMQDGSLLLSGTVDPAPTSSELQPEANGHATSTKKKKKAPARPADGEDNTNRRLLNLPPVVGSYLHYPNKTLLYRPFPPDVDHVRNKLFHIEQPVLLNSQQISDYWPHISNFYNRSQQPKPNANGTVEEFWECRIRRRIALKSRDKTTGQGIRQRGSKDDLLSDVDSCKVRLIFTSFTKHVVSQEACGAPGFGNCLCVPEWLYIKRTSNNLEDNTQHTHELDTLDSYKRSNAILYFCKLKVEEGQYSYATVSNWVKDKYGPITAQLQHLNKADVANVARFWRAQNKDVELRTQIIDETDSDRELKACIDSFQTASAKQLRKALTEVCKIHPYTANIIAPLMEKQSENQDQETPILQGYDIALPTPGLGLKRKLACDPPDPEAPPSEPRRPPPPPPGEIQSPPQAPLAYAYSYPMLPEFACPVAATPDFQDMLLPTSSPYPTMLPRGHPQHDERPSWARPGPPELWSEADLQLRKELDSQF